MSKTPFSYYTTSELARAATAAKISTKTRIQMLDEIKRREEAENEVNVDALIADGERAVDEAFYSER